MKISQKNLFFLFLERWNGRLHQFSMIINKVSQEEVKKAAPAGTALCFLLNLLINMWFLIQNRQFCLLVKDMETAPVHRKPYRISRPDCRPGTHPGRTAGIV